MPTYGDLLIEMGQCGPYMGDVVGKCQREIRAFSGTGPSRIDNYLRESATYAAAKEHRKLKNEFSELRAEPGYLIWKEGRTNGIKASFPVEIDETSGIVRQLDKDLYGLLCDVFPCLHRKNASGDFVPWKTSRGSASKKWLKPTQEEIDMHDSSKTKFGTTVVGGRRIGQIGWRRKVAKLWKNQCAITKCKIESLLDGAHILPHRECTTDQSLDEQNGIFLATHLHKAFDRGLISFSSKGKLLFSNKLTPDDRKALGIPNDATLPFLPDRTKEYLKWHRHHYNFE